MLLLTLLPHAVPELLALFLPLAAWIIASRRDAWEELLAATFATSALALPVLVLAANLEVFVWPHVLRLASPVVLTRRDASPGTTLCIVLSQARPASPRSPCTTMAGTLSNVTDTSFQADVLESEQPVLVDFWAPWCGPCRVVAPVLEEIAGERPDLRIVKLNVDENQATAAKYEVLSIPTMILFKNGEVAKKVIGAYPKKRLEAELEPALA